MLLIYARSHQIFTGDVSHRLLALFGGEFANHYLSQSTSWLDSIILAAGPLGVPTIIVATIRVAGSRLLKMLIGQARESNPSIEKALKSSTSNEVCERWDGTKVIRLETKDPLIKELIHTEGKWYDLNGAENEEIVTRSTTSESQNDAERRIDHPAVPPNLSLNISDHSCWELPAAATFGISLQLVVLTIAGLTTFHPQWKAKYPVQPYEFYCMAGGTLLLTIGLVTCALTVEQSTNVNTYNTKPTAKVDVLWLQRGTSDRDQSDGHCILQVKPRRIRTSCKNLSYHSTPWKALALAGTLATSLGYIIQFIGLGGMHWPTQASQFAITLIMTGVRALIRRAPPKPTSYEGIATNHELDWLTTLFPERTINGKGGAQVWRFETGESLGKFGDSHLLSSKHIAALLEPEITRRSEESFTTQSEENLVSSSGGEITTLPSGEITTLPGGEKWRAQRMLRKRQGLGALCKWTGPGRKWAISLAAAIDTVMNVLHPILGLKSPFRWPLNVRAGEEKQRIIFTVKKEFNRWESDFSEIEAALSLGLFGAEHNTIVGNGLAKSGSEDWFRREVEKVQTKTCVTLLGPRTPAALRNLKWFLGPQNGKLKELTLHRHNGGKIFDIGQDRPRSFRYSTLRDEVDPLIMKYPMVGFESSWENDGHSEQHTNDSPTSSTCLAAVSEVDLELLYARHMFLAFMWSIARDIKTRKGSTEVPGFDPKDQESWQSLQLHNTTLLELANCVQRAGLGDMEDAYLSIIPPLSTTKLLKPKGLGVFEVAQNVALEELSKENWWGAYRVHHLIFQNYTTFGDRDEMAIKATALLVEFFRLLYRAWGPEDIKDRVRTDLWSADGGVLNHLATFYEWQGWSDVRKKLPQNHRDDDLELKEVHDLKVENVHDFLGQTLCHRLGMRIDTKNMEMLSKSCMDVNISLWCAKDIFGRTVLHYAAYKGCFRTKIDWFESILSNVGKADAVDRYGMTALHAAAEAGNDKLIDVLIRGGAPRDEKFQNRTALHIATERGNASVVLELIRAKVDTTLTAPGGRTALHIAVLGSRNHVVTMLLAEEGFDAMDDLKRTALHLAAMNLNLGKQLDDKEESGEGEVEQKGVGKEGGDDKEDKKYKESASGWVSRLIEKLGTKGKNATDVNRKTALHLAAEIGNHNMVRVLVEGRVDLNAKDIDGFSALDRATENNQAKVVHMLLEEGVGFDVGTLHWAASVGDEVVVRGLVNKKVLDINAKGTIGRASGKTALHLAVKGRRMADEEGNHEAVMRILLDNGADVKAEDGYRRTAMCLAADEGYKEGVRILLDEGVNVNARNSLRQTALHWAAGYGNVGMVRMLLQRGANVHATDGDGLTPLQWTDKDELTKRNRRPLLLQRHPQTAAAVTRMLLDYEEGDRNWSRNSFEY